MIAPLRESTTTAPDERRRLAEARCYVATILPTRPEGDRDPAVAPWKAWALVGWLVLVTAFWAASMLGWW